MIVKRFLLVLLAASSAGCASYSSHYAVFPAENSTGEPRQVRLSWQTADYPDWWFVADKATPVKVETQCSERVWRIRDDADPDAGSCAPGVRACGDSRLDVYAPAGRAAGADDPCLVINPSEPGARIPELGDKLELLVSCRPAVTRVGLGDEMRNLDYLRASSVPYTVYVQNAPRGSLRAKMPELDDSVCDAE